MRKRCGREGLKEVVGLHGSNSKFAKLKKENEGQPHFVKIPW